MTLVLMPVPERQWREPSQAQPKDQFGNANQTRFRLTARLNDGFIRWRGWFDSRDDADAFLYALAINIIDGTPVPVEMWRLPSPWWHPDLGEGLTYDFATQVFLSASPGSLQSWTSTVDWWNSSNTVETVGAGASGAADGTGAQNATGGGGGAYNKISNFSIAVPGTTAVSYELGAGGTSVTANGNDVSGNNGGDSWFGGSSLGASSVGSKGGSAGNHNAGAASGGAGGVGASGVGTSSFDGGRGGNLSTAGGGASGGGGAAGKNGAGNHGADGTNTTTAGGSGDAGSGGGAGTAGGLNGGAGGNGTEWDGSHGSGGGGGGGGNGGAGGNYGGGGGAAGAGISPSTSGAGIQGLAVLTYTPFKRGAFFSLF